jgi:DNA-binding response OmpR family regulator
MTKLPQATSEELRDEGAPVRVSLAQRRYELVGGNRPALIFLGPWLERPDTGWHLLENLRRTPLSARTPMLICSTSVLLPAHQPFPPHWSPVAILRKPFELDDLLGQIRALLRSVSLVAASELAHAELRPADWLATPTL